MDEQAAAKHRTFVHVVVDGERWLRNDVLVVNIGSNANDAVRRGAKPGDEFHHGICPIDVPIDGILIGKHALGQ